MASAQAAIDNSHQDFDSSLRDSLLLSEAKKQAARRGAKKSGDPNWVKAQQATKLQNQPRQVADEYYSDQKEENPGAPVELPRKEKNNPRKNRQINQLIDAQEADGIDSSLINRLNIQQTLMSIGQDLGRQIEAGSFKAFYIALFIAILKDFVDILALFFTLGIGGTIAAFILSPLLFGIMYFSHFRGVIFFMKKRIRRYLIRKIAYKAIVSVFIEFTPGINAIPTATALVIWAKLDADMAKRELGEEQRQVVEAINNA